MSQGEGDLIISDVGDADEKRLRPPAANQEGARDLPVVVMSAQNTFMTAIRASERGAYGISAVAVRPEGSDLDRRPGAGRAAGEAQPRSDDEGTENMRSSAALRRCRTSIGVLARLMQTDLTVMMRRRIRHRQGTGRARAHDYGQAPQGTVSSAINIGAIPRDLIETSCSATRRAPSPAPRPAPPAASSRRRAATSSSTRSATCRWRRRPAFCACSSGRVHDGRRPDPDQDQCPHRRGDQQGPATAHQSGAVPRGPVLPPQVVPRFRLPPLRSVPRTSGPRPPLLHDHREGGAAGGEADRAGGARPAETASLAGQRARAREPGAAPDGALSPGRHLGRPDRARARRADPGAAAAGRAGHAGVVGRRHLATYFAGFGDDLPPPGLYHRIPCATWSSL